MADMPSADIAAMAGAGVISGVAGVAMIAEEAARLAATAQEMGGGNYAFRPGELQTVLGQWTDLQNTVEAALKSVTGPVHAHTPTALAPGNEQASDVVATAAANSNHAYLAYLTDMKNYVDGYVANLSGALQRYLQTEQAQADAINAKQSHLA